MAGTILVNSDLDLNSGKIVNLANGTATNDAVNLGQLNSAVEGLAWKDSCRAASTANLNLSAPGATIDGVSMAASDRLLVKDQTAPAENGIYIWNGAATPATRALDASTGPELEGAVVTVEEGTGGAGTSWRQTQVNFTIDVGSVVWTAFGTSVPAASESTAGIAELATQGETDTGADDLRIVTPLKLANYSGRAKRYAVTFGDGAATSYVLTHNLNTNDVTVYIKETTGSKRQVLLEVDNETSVNSVTVKTNSAPASNSLRAVIIA